MPSSSIGTMLQAVAATSFRFHPTDSRSVDLGLDVANAFMVLSPVDRKTVVSQVDSHCAKNLLALSGLLAEHAINTRDKKWLEAAVVLHVVEDFRNDYRENYRFLVLVFQAASTIGTSFKKIVTGLLPISSERSASNLQNFVDRDERLNRLDAYDIKEDVIDGETRFVPIPNRFSLKGKASK